MRRHSARTEGVCAATANRSRAVVENGSDRKREQTCSTAAWRQGKRPYRSGVSHFAAFSRLLFADSQGLGMIESRACRIQSSLPWMCPPPDIALALAARLAPFVGALKIGSELFTSAGPDIIRRVRATGAAVFLDLKFHDIPNTVAKSVEAAVRLDVQMLTVHASGGLAMLQAAEKAAQKTARDLNRPPPLVLAVTVLTSLDAVAMAQIGFADTIGKQVERLAGLAVTAGLRGLVCSPPRDCRLAGPAAHRIPACHARHPPGGHGDGRSEAHAHARGGHGGGRHLAGHRTAHLRRQRPGRRRGADPGRSFRRARGSQSGLTSAAPGGFNPARLCGPQEFFLFKSGLARATVCSVRTLERSTHE